MKSSERQPRRLQLESLSRVSQISVRSDIDVSELRRFVREEIHPQAEKWDKEEYFPVETVRKIHELGFLSAFIPKDLGGSDASTLDMLSIGREISYGSRGVACTLAAHMAAMMPVILFANEKLKNKVAGAVLSEGELGSFCFTEANAGSDIFRIETKAKKVPGGYVLTGAKSFITNASHSRHFIIMAKLVGVENPRQAMNAFYVHRDSPGLRFGNPLSKLGFRDSDTAEVFLDDVFVPTSQLLGEEGMGLRIAVRALQRSRTFFAGTSAGLCDRAHDITVNFLEGRAHFGRALLDQPQIRSQLAQLETEAQAMWLLGCFAAAEWEAGTPSLLSSCMSKMASGQIAMKYASAAVELFGAWGCMSEYEVSRIFRDAKFFEILEGPTFVQQVLIAKELFGSVKSAA